MFLTAAIRLLKPAQLDGLLRRREAHLEGLDDEVRRVLEAVHHEGDHAVINTTHQLDGVRMEESQLVVGVDGLHAALAGLDPETRTALEAAANCLIATQQALAQTPVCISGDGVRVEVVPVAALRAGIHAAPGRPGNPLPILGAVIAARIAGVEDITVTIPPGPEGKAPPLLLAAAALARADRVFVASALPGVAALAYGTDSVAPVEKLAGAGSRQVSVAKKLLFGKLDIDGLSGPAEFVILADAQADPRLIALDLCGQAEADPATLPLVITDDETLAAAVRKAVAVLLKEIPRREQIQAALLGGGVMVCESLDEAVRIAERIAPEMLQLAVREPQTWLPHLRRAGLILCGQTSPPPLALAASGLAAVLPTGGTARYASGLSVRFFQRMQGQVSFDAEALKREGPAALRLALAGGAAAQAEAMKARLGE